MCNSLLNSDVVFVFCGFLHNSLMKASLRRVRHVVSLINLFALPVNIVCTLKLLTTITHKISCNFQRTNKKFLPTDMYVYPQGGTYFSKSNIYLSKTIKSNISLCISEGIPSSNFLFQTLKDFTPKVETL